MCNNILAFAPTGKVFLALLNYPGSWHDAQIVSFVTEVLVRLLKDNCICVDQGFPRSGVLQGVLVGPYSQKKEAALAPEVRDSLLRQAAVYVSLRQASEWGMRALQGTFPRLKSRLPSCSVKRQMLLTSIVLIHNFRTELVGLNQIATVFNPEYEQYMNLAGYDRIRRYYYADL